jgi:hypothetical protein
VNTYDQIEALMDRLLPSTAQMVSNLAEVKYLTYWAEQEGNYKHPPKNIRGYLTGALKNSIHVASTDHNLFYDTADITATGEAQNGFPYAHYHEYGGTVYGFPQVSYMNKTATEATPLIAEFIAKEITRCLS